MSVVSWWVVLPVYECCKIKKAKGIRSKKLEGQARGTRLKKLKGQAKGTS